MDQVDWAIVHELQEDARLSFSSLSRAVHLSTPAVAERVRRLEKAGILNGYHARIDSAAAGWQVQAFVRLRCYGPTCILKDDSVAEWPEILELHKIAGDDCCVLKVLARSMPDLEALINRLAEYGTPSSTIVLSSPISRSNVVSP